MELQPIGRDAWKPQQNVVAWDQVTEIPLPSGPIWLRVALCDAQGRVFAQWGFERRHSGGLTRLCLDLSTIDQGSATLVGGEGIPIAHDFASGLLPTAGIELFVLVENHAAWPISRMSFPVALHDGARRSAHARWLGAQTQPAQWFYVEITTFCNLECPFCPSKDLRRPRRHMDLDLAQSVFRKIANYLAAQELREAYMQFRPMVFLHIMGEPVLHPKLTAIVELARREGLAVGLFTNVTLLNSKNIAKLIEARPDLVTLSINAASEEGYRALGAKDTFRDQHERATNFLKARAEAKALGMAVDVQYMTSLGRNVRGMGLLRQQREVWRLFERWHAIVRTLHRDHRASARSFPKVEVGTLADSLEPQADPSYRIPLGHGVQLAIKSGCSFGNAVLPAGRRVKPATRGFCPFNSPFQQFAVFVDGSVSFCNLDHENSVGLGNLAEEEIEDIWNGVRMARIRNEMASGILTEPLCQRCLGEVTSH